MLKIERTARIEEVDLADDIAEAEHQASADERGDDGGEDLAEHAHDALRGILVCPSRSLRRLLGNALDTRDRGEFLVEVRHIVADDDLELPCLRKGALRARQALDGLYIGLSLVNEHEAHARHAVGDGRDILLAAHEVKELSRILRVLCHASSFLPRSNGTTRLQPYRNDLSE